MDTTITLPASTYKLLQRQATEVHSTPEQVAESIIRQQLGNTVHIEQRSTRFGSQAYLRGTRVAVRHIASFLNAGQTVDEIIQNTLPHLPISAVYEAVAYYYDHRAEIDAELAANTAEAVSAHLRTALSPEQYAQLTGKAI